MTVGVKYKPNAVPMAHCPAARLYRRYAFGDQHACIHQHAGWGALFRPMAFQAAYFLADGNEIVGDVAGNATFMHDDIGFHFALPIMKINRDRALAVVYSLQDTVIKDRFRCRALAR